MSIWQGERYHGERMVVNGELIDHYAYEFGDDSLEIAKQYDAEQFDALLEARMQHWIEHHDKVLGNTVNVLERENKELQRKFDRLSDIACEVTLDWMSHACVGWSLCKNDGDYKHCNDKSCGNLVYKELLEELGIEVSE